LELGFEPGVELTPREERSYLTSGYEFIFGSPNGRNLLELQWQILPRFYAVEFQIEGFFDRAIPQTIGGLTVRSLCAEDLLLVLCAHAAKHAWIQLSWLCDIARLAQQVDWSSVWQESDALGIRRMVEVTFTLAHVLLGAPLPPNMASDAQVGSLAGEIIPLIGRSAPLDTESMTYFRLMTRVRERRRDRGRFWWRLATTPTTGEWSAVRLPAPLFPLYHLVRAIRIGRRLF
jgi:hypothetical protein